MPVNMKECTHITLQPSPNPLKKMYRVAIHFPKTLFTLELKAKPSYMVHCMKNIFQLLFRYIFSETITILVKLLEESFASTCRCMDHVTWCPKNSKKNFNTF